MSLKSLSLEELRYQWAKKWGKQPHGTMGRKMLVESIRYKQWETVTGGLSGEQKARIDKLVKNYKSSPSSLNKAIQLKPGTRLARTWKGQKHLITIERDGFEYRGRSYSSLSQIANEITESRWNGWLFFGLKK